MAEPTKNCENERDNRPIDLRNCVLAGVLAWLLPGAGHCYQRRYFKAALFAICIWPIFIAGLFMGSYRDSSDSSTRGQYNFARNVYCSWREGDRRLYFIPQACIGCAALPAMWQARFPKDADGTFMSTAFAPPRIPSEYRTRAHQPDANEIIYRLHSWFDVGVIFTVVAGLLNLFAIFDAIGGPAPSESDEDSDSNEDKDKSKADK